MLIGIDVSRAFLPERTGIGEYSYQVIKHLRDVIASEDKVVLYVRKSFGFRISDYKTDAAIHSADYNSQFTIHIALVGKRIHGGCFVPKPDFPLPEHWSIRGIWAPRFWTQIGLSLEMLLHRPDVLFVPAHTVPVIHPKRTCVTIHGLEYEASPESYAWHERLYMRWSIRFSVRFASQIITVSENTKKDLINLYQVPSEKITVIYEGVSQNFQFPISNFQPNQNASNTKLENLDIDSKFRIQNSRFFLFIGRLEERKNVRCIIEAFEYFKERTKLSHQLVLVGKSGYGNEKIRSRIQASSFKNDIRELGYVSEVEKWKLLNHAEVFVFPSLYEGFGLPVVEAQLVGTPVITSDTSSLPEIAGDGALLVDPTRPREIGRAMVTLTTDPRRRAGIIDKATQNVKRFSWVHCARDVNQLLVPLKRSSPS